MKNIEKKIFAPGEVITTLVITGIMTAVIIPTLINSYNAHSASKIKRETINILADKFNK